MPRVPTGWPDRATVPRLILGASRASVILLALGASQLAMAKSPPPTWEESDKLPAVQNRLYRNEHEFLAGVGVLPVDAFYKGVVFNGGYTWHITDLWGIEGRFSYLKNIKTSLRQKLEMNFSEPSSKFAELNWFVEGGAVLKPIYGKLSFMNKTLVYGEIYFSLTGVFARITGGSATDEEPQGKGGRWGFGAAPGFGLRAYLATWCSVRFDLRNLLLYSAGEGHYPLALSLNISFTTRSDL